MYLPLLPIIYGIKLEKCLQVLWYFEIYALLIKEVSHIRTDKQSMKLLRSWIQIFSYNIASPSRWSPIKNYHNNITLKLNIVPQYIIFRTTLTFQVYLNNKWCSMLWQRPYVSARLYHSPIYRSQYHFDSVFESRIFGIVGFWRWLRLSRVLTLTNEDSFNRVSNRAVLVRNNCILGRIIAGNSTCSFWFEIYDEV